MTVLNILANKLDASPHIVEGWRDVHKDHPIVKWYGWGAFINICLSAATQAFLIAPLYNILSMQAFFLGIEILFVLGIIGKYLVYKDDDKPEG